MDARVRHSGALNKKKNEKNKLEEKEKRRKRQVTKGRAEKPSWRRSRLYGHESLGRWCVGVKSARWKKKDSMYLLCYLSLFLFLPLLPSFLSFFFCIRIFFLNFFFRLILIVHCSDHNCLSTIRHGGISLALLGAFVARGTASQRKRA